jgi:hypothetical protein
MHQTIIFLYKTCQKTRLYVFGVCCSDLNIGKPFWMMQLNLVLQHLLYLYCCNNYYNFMHNFIIIYFLNLKAGAPAI